MVREIDEKGGFSWETWHKLAEIGIPGLTGPEEYGGAGVDSLLTQEEVCLMTQNIARERVMHKLLERQAAKYGKRTYMYFEDEKFK